jgi:molybdate transport system substrate-binding protein
VHLVWRRFWPIWFAAVLALPGCGGSDDERLIVYAASSLTDVFARLELEFETAHPDTDLVVNYGGSSSLAAQIGQGAPVDVFASADQATMQRVLDEADGEPLVFAHNRLAIAVEAGNPEAIGDLSGLVERDLIVVVADSAVPSGAYAAEVLALADLVLEPDSYESNVRAVAAKVALGEADAGIVYRTDIVANDEQLDEVVIADALNVSAQYPIVVVKDGPVARAFVEFVTGESGRQALAAAGFALP